MCHSPSDSGYLKVPYEANRLRLEKSRSAWAGQSRPRTHERGTASQRPEHWQLRSENKRTAKGPEYSKVCIHTLDEPSRHLADSIVHEVVHGQVARVVIAELHTAANLCQDSRNLGQVLPRLDIDSRRNDVEGFRSARGNRS
jgi:hypothetical protein